MKPTRRGFIGAMASGLAGLVAGAELDPERLLWVPGRRTFFIPEAPTLYRAVPNHGALFKLPIVPGMLHAEGGYGGMRTMATRVCAEFDSRGAAEVGDLVRMGMKITAVPSEAWIEPVLRAEAEQAKRFERGGGVHKTRARQILERELARQRKEWGTVWG